MATYVHSPGMDGVEARRRAERINNVMEDAAEEVLNGLLCHYEPRKQERSTETQGILRRRKRGYKSNNRVRWIDQAVDEIETPQVAGCSMRQACFDATTELGCAPMMNTKEAVEKARAKKASSPRREVAVYDDEGNPVYIEGMNKRKPLVAPNPPPPSKSEPYFPQLCGVKINCWEDEEQLRLLAAKSLSYNEDDENSLMESVDNNQTPTSDSSQEKKTSTRRRSKKSLKPLRQIIQEYQFGSDEEEEADWGNVSNAESSPSPKKSSMFKRVFSGRKKTKKQKSPVVPPPPVMSSEDDDDSSPRRPVAKEPKSPLGRFFTRISPKATRTDEEGDWDESVPVAGLRHIDKATKGTKRRDARRSKSPRPVPQKSPKALASRRSRSKSPGHSKYPESPHSVQGAVSPPITTRPGRSERFPPRVTKSSSDSRSHQSHQQRALEADDLMERESFVTAHRRSLEDEEASPVDESRRSTNDGKDWARKYVNDDGSKGRPTVNPLGGENEKQKSSVTDRETERRDDGSERRGQQQVFNHPGQHKHRSSRPTSEDERMERMSYITANREASPRRGRRGRSRSPRFSRRQSYEGAAPYPVDPRMVMYGNPPRPEIMAPPPPPYPPGAAPYPHGYPRYFDPTNPQAYLVQPTYAAPLGDPYDRQWTVPTNENEADDDDGRMLVANKVSSISEDSGGEAKNQLGLSWEERTRQALDRLRNGMAAMTMDTPANKDDVPSPSEARERPLPHLPPPQVPYHLPIHPPAYNYQLQPQPEPRRVTFGEPQHVYYDDVYLHESGTPNSRRGPKKNKKLRLRGTKFLGGAIGRVRRSKRSNASREYDDDWGDYTDEVYSEPPLQYHPHPTTEHHVGRQRRRSRSPHASRSRSPRACRSRSQSPHRERRRSRSPYDNRHRRSRLSAA